MAAREAMCRRPSRAILWALLFRPVSLRAMCAPAMCAPAVWVSAVWVPVSSMACGADVVVPLGQDEPLPTFTDAGRRVRFLNEQEEDEATPTFTEDLLHIYFSSSRPGGPGGEDVWFATRLTRFDAFDPPRLVPTVNSEQDETSPAISADGLTLYVGSDRPYGASQRNMNIWRATRESTKSPWGPLVYVEGLNSDADDIPRPLAFDGLAMPLASRRDGQEYQTYLGTRPGLAAEFDAVEPLSELWAPGTSTLDAFMTNDGMMVFFNREPAAGQGELYMAWRTSLQASFGEAVTLPFVNTSADERDPWVSADGERLFFASNRRDGEALDIYGTKIELPRFEP
jgi:hypothetical protein